MIYVVIASGGLVLGVYERSELAHMHMRCVTGAIVIPTLVRHELPQSVLDKLGDEFDDDPTPVTKPFRRV